MKKSHNGHYHRRNGHHQSWEVHLADQVLVDHITRFNAGITVIGGSWVVPGGDPVSLLDRRSTSDAN
jgi:hypothetical protein